MFDGVWEDQTNPSISTYVRAEDSINSTTDENAQPDAMNLLRAINRPQ